MSEDDESVDQSDVSEEWASAVDEQNQSGQTNDKGVDPLSAIAPVIDGAKAVEMDELTSGGSPSGNGAPDLAVIMDIPVSISMEVGNTEISIRNLLQLNQGSVIELDRLAGEPLDVLVNGTLIAHGEVVVVNEKFGIRMTDVISPSERIKKLR
jgi:flagellar motor switch protein FliN/FliY|tara:strand:- start:332 stop:790 length:459 start_codon:yes stop_codon:yes gene_type:complete